MTRFLRRLWRSISPPAHVSLDNWLESRDGEYPWVDCPDCRAVVRGAHNCPGPRPASADIPSLLDHQQGGRVA